MEKANHSIRTLCRVMGVARSGYFKWRQQRPSQRAREDAKLTSLIEEIHEESDGTYGAPRIHVELREEHGVRVSRKRVARLMRAKGIQGVHRRRQRRSKATKAQKERVYEDLVQREFTADEPDRLWLADITQHQTDEGWLYIAAVLDAYSKRIVGWSMASNMETELVVNAVEMAVSQRQPALGLIHHSDQGSQYASLAFGHRLTEAGLVGSMGSRGDAFDNATMESFWATLQTELLDRRQWATRTELKTAIFRFIEIFYNRKRRHSALGHISPDEYEKRYPQHQAAA